jgi:glucose-6-phosphate 1-epimerase
MPQHGFLRNNYWKVVGDVYDTEEDGAGCELSLDLKDVIHARGDGRWKKQQEGEESSNDTNCSLILQVKVQSHTLTTTLTIHNTGETSFDYQTLLHTYFKIDNSGALDSSACYVNGLDRYTVEDKITGETYVQSDEKIIVDREFDRIYTPPVGLNKVDVIVSTGKEVTSKVNLVATAKMSDGKNVPVSVVVWNPYIEKAKAMGDFGDEQYQDMICVEPGLLSGEGTTLEPNKHVVFTQVMRQVLPTDVE